MVLESGRSVLGRYRVSRLLGEGGMGAVFLGEHEHLGIPVALKVLTSDLTTDVLGRFRREAQLMARVRHPNVVSVLDYGFLDDGAPCLAMEFIQGEPLDQRLRRLGAMPWHDAVSLMLGVVAGLDAIHAVGVIHRDLKPSNIVVTAGPPEAVKIIDFGIARPVDGQATRYTQTGQMIGTPAYMAPEQIMGFALDARTDLYAAGMMLYELLTGSLPFAESGMSGVFRRINGSVPPPASPPGRPDFPPPLVDALDAVLRPDPEQRIRTAREFYERLQGVLRGEPTGSVDRAPEAPPPPAPPPWMSATAMSSPPRSGIQERPAEAGASRYVLVARIPPSRLGNADERRWLAGVAQGSRAFTLGAQYWLAMQSQAVDADAAARAATALASALQERYGALVRVEWTTVDPGFGLTAAALTGAAPLPPQLAALVARLASAA